MKKVFGAGRWPLCATLIASGLLMIAPQAHAAHWEMSFRPDGTNTPAFDDVALEDGDGSDLPEEETWFDVLSRNRTPDPTTGRFPVNNGQLSFGQTSQDIAKPSTGSSPRFRAMSASTQGSVTIHLKWVQDPEDETPAMVPKVVLLKIWGVSAAETTAPPPTSNTAVEAQFGRKSGTTGEEGDERAIYKWCGATVYGSHPVTIPLVVSEGESEVEYTFPVKSKATSQQVDYTNFRHVLLCAGFNLYAKPDDVGVAISSDIETSWQKWTGAVFDLPDASNGFSF